MRKLAIACVLIFLVASFASVIYDNTQSELTKDSIGLANSSNYELNVDVVDSENNPLDCDISLRNPWNQAIIGQIENSSETNSVEFNDGAGIMIEPSCPNYSVPYQAPVLLSSNSNITIVANQINRSISFNSSSSVSVDIYSQSSSFEITDHAGVEEIMVPENENIEVFVNSTSFGISVYLIQAGHSTQTLNISETNQMNIGSFENPNQNLSYRINSNLTTLNTAVSCTTICNYTVPNVLVVTDDSTFEDSVYISAHHNNSKLDEHVSLDDQDFSLFSQFNKSKEEDMNSASIEFESSTGNMLNATYSEYMVFDFSQGIPSLPHSDLGIIKQSQLLFGKGHSTIIENLTWSDAVSNLCCIYDLRTMNVISSEYQPVYHNVSGFEGSWGWNISLEMSAESRGLSVSRIGILFGNDLRQTAPLTVNLPEGMEYYSSNGQDWISGSSRSFTVQRNTTSIIGEMVITIKENTPPLVQTSATTESDFLLESNSWPTDLRVNFLVQVIDGYLASHNCSTIFSSGGDEIYRFEGMNDEIPTIESLTNNLDEIVTLTTCYDENNLSSSSRKVWSLDSQSPLLDMLQSDVGCSDEFVWLENDSNSSLPNSNFCEFFIVEPGTSPRFIVTSSDDTSESVSVTWTSNISEAWNSQSNFLQETWREANYANSASDDPQSRRGSAPITSYVLTLTLTDDVGHTSTFDYQIILRSTMDDLIVNPELKRWTSEGWVTTSTPAVNDVIVLDFSDSFHPHLALTEFNFSLMMDYVIDTQAVTGQIPIYQGEEFFLAFNISEFNFVDGSELGHGSFDFDIIAQNNQTVISNSIEVDIYPEKIPDVYVERILTDESIEPGIESISVVVMNDGATSTEAKICVQEDCVYYFIAGWNGINQGYTIVPMNVNIQPGQNLVVEIEYDLTDENGNLNGESENYSFTSNIKASSGFSVVEIVIVLIMLAGIFAFTINSTKSEKSTKTYKPLEEE